MDSNLISRTERKIEKGNEATFSDYLAIARLNHSTKHIFIVPGFVLAALLRGSQIKSVGLEVLLGLIVAVCIASANYVINEYLDRDFDRYHPTKSQRSAVQHELRVADDNYFFRSRLSFLPVSGIHHRSTVGQSAVRQKLL